MDKQELQHLRKETWNALQTFQIDARDSRNVARWEKLSKLFMSLHKAIEKQESQTDPQEIEIEV